MTSESKGHFESEPFIPILLMSFSAAATSLLKTLTSALVVSASGATYIATRGEITWQFTLRKR